jgi:hypothetical protein
MMSLNALMEALLVENRIITVNTSLVLQRMECVRWMLWSVLMEALLVEIHTITVITSLVVLVIPLDVLHHLMIVSYLRMELLAVPLCVNLMGIK